MCSSEIAQGGKRLDDEEVIDLGSESMSMSFDDDIEVLEEYAAVSPPVSSTSKPTEPIRRRESLRGRLGINFQRPSSRNIGVNNIPVRRDVGIDDNASAGKIDVNNISVKQCRVPSVRHDVDDNGYCSHHPEIQLYRRRTDDSGDWVVVRKKCPSCISKDCPNMLGGSEKNETSNLSGEQMKMDKSNLTRRNSFVQTIVDDFSSNGDKKILRAVGRTATVNAAVLMTAATGGVGASAIGYATGGAITAKRLSDGVAKNDEKEVTKSLAVFGAATGASIAGQALTGALMIGVAGASLPVAGAVAFGVGCVSGISAGALSEWTVDGVMDKMKLRRNKDMSCKEVQDTNEETEIRDESTSIADDKMKLQRDKEMSSKELQDTDEEKEIRDEATAIADDKMIDKEMSNKEFQDTSEEKEIRDEATAIPDDNMKLRREKEMSSKEFQDTNEEK